MFEVVRFIAVAVVVSLAAGAGSVAWPKFTSNPRPPLVEKVYEIARNTPVGQKTRDVLGVTDSSELTPLDLRSEANTLVATATSAIEKKVQTVIATQAVLQLMHQINALDPDQQKEIRAVVCSTQSGSID